MPVVVLITPEDAKKFPFSAEIINEGRRILAQDTDEVPILEISLAFIDFAKKHGIACEVKIHTDDILVHLERLVLIHAHKYVLRKQFLVFT